MVIFHFCYSNAFPRIEKFTPSGYTMCNGITSYPFPPFPPFSLFSFSFPRSSGRKSDRASSTGIRARRDCCSASASVDVSGVGSVEGSVKKVPVPESVRCAGKSMLMT